jgi:hypothetical protein
MATAKNINRSTDPNVRKSPPLSANAFPVDHVAKGNDGNQWIITEDGNGIKRWVKVNKTASKSSSTKSSTSQTASSTPAVETQQEALDRYNTYIDKTSTIYYTLPKTNIVVYVEDKLNIPKYQILIGNNVIVNENDPDFKKQLQDYLAQRFVIKNATIFSGGRNDITDLSFEFSNANQSIKEDELNNLDQWLYDEMNVRNGKQLAAPVQSSSTNQLKDFVDGLSNIGSLYYEMKETKVKVFQVTRGSGTSYQFVIELDTGTNKSLIATNLKKYIADQESIERNVSITNPIGKILIVVFEFRDNYTTLIKKEDLDRIDNYLIPRINIKASTTSNNPSKFKEYDLLLTANKQDNQKFYDLNFITSVIKDPSGSNNYWIEFKQCVARAYTGGVYESDLISGSRNIYPYIPQIGDIIALKYSGNPDLTIKIVNIDLPNNEIEVESSASGSTNRYYTKEQFNTLLIERGIEVLNFDPNARSSNIQTAVQEAETKVDDIVFSAPVVPIGTEDQRNATDKLVDEFIAKNENNLKKLSVENVGLLSTIDKTLEFIKAKFGTPAAVTSVSNVVNTAPQPASSGNIDNYKLIQFIGDNGERQVIEFKKFKTGKNANVFKYFIGDVFLDTNYSNADGDFIYKEIIGAQEGGVYAGYIHYIDSYPGKIGAGLTWDSRVKKISVGDFEGKIESGEWTSVPGANKNLNKISSAVSNVSTSANRPFELGDVVKIKSDSQFFGSNTSNPANVEGVVIDIVKGKSKAFPIRVKWANGKENTYPKDDLFFVSKSIASASTQAPAVTTTAGGSAIAGVGDTVIFFASREKTNLQGIVKAIVTGTDGKPYLRINVNGKFYLKQQGSVKKV